MLPYGSYNLVSIGLGNSFSSLWCTVIACGYMLKYCQLEPSEQMPLKFQSKYKIINQRNGIENDICKLLAIRLIHYCVKHHHHVENIQTPFLSITLYLLSLLQHSIFSPSTQLSWVPFYNGFMSPWSKSRKHSICSHMNNNYWFRSQLCTCHDSWAVVTCAEVWPKMEICDLTGSLGS